MPQELVSIVTPAYNAAEFVGQAIASVQAQSYPDWEMLVVDDCSKDSTREVVSALAAADPRVRLIAHSTNQGPAMAREAALRAARGRFLAFLDSDDWWLPDKLTHQLAFMQETGTILSYTEFRRVRADGSAPGRRIMVPDSLNYWQLLRNTAIATSTAMVDRAITGELRMTRTHCDDIVLWLGILKRGYIARGLHEDLMRYRVLGGSWSRNKWRYARRVWLTYRQIEGLDYPRAAWCFLGYAINGVLKYSRF